MADYWHARYVEALSKVNAARSPQARSAYSDLAAHYRAMREFCDRPKIFEGVRTAA
jgi:hypothetical protein